MQRIVDERDSYLESIIELEQDKDYLNFKLKSNNGNGNGYDNDVTSNKKNKDLIMPDNFDNDLKNLTINELINNLVNNSTSICDITNGSSQNSKIDPNTGLIDLNETNLKLLKLIDSINKNKKGGDGKMGEEMEEEIYCNEDTEYEKNKNKTLMISENLLNDLKNKKELASNWNQKIAIELVECKIRLKQLINEIEEKCECIEGLKDEMDEVRKQFNKLRNENCDLQQKAALANVYEDELESLREKSVKVDRYECELAKLKERIDEFQLEEPRLNELKEENLILIETRTFMEKQLEEYQQRLISVQRLDSDLNKYKQEIDDLNQQGRLDKKRMCHLCEKNAKLELEMKNVLNQNVNLDEELTYYKQKYTFTSAELTKQVQVVNNVNKKGHTQNMEIIEKNKMRLSEAERKISELNQNLRLKDSELSRLKELSRSKEIRNDECMAKLKALDGQLNIEQENKLRLERVLDHHKLEIKELQIKLDDCVNETKKLDFSIREAAKSNENKSNENEENFNKLVDSHDQLNQSYKSLLNDHESLQKLYLQLEADYDDLYGELTKKHSLLNGLNSDFDELNMKYSGSLEIIDKLETNLNEVLDKSGGVSVGTETEKKGDTETDIHEFYKNKIDVLNVEINCLEEKKEYVEVKLMDLSVNYEKINTENFNLKEIKIQMNNELENQEKTYQTQFIQINHLNGQMKTMEILTEKLEDEKSQLFEQLHLLLQQNQEILTQTLANKDLYHEETKAYMQQLHNLQRQKEGLEQKIMEQYKNCPSLSQKQKNKKSFQSNSNNSGISSNNSLVDMVSKTTRNLVQKVRNKSSQSSSSHHDMSIDNQSAYEDITESNINIYENHDNLLFNRSLNSKISFCHKYSEDDINYLNLQNTLDKELVSNGGNMTNPNTKSHGAIQSVGSSNRQTVSSLSSSSSTSSASSGSTSSSTSSSASSIPQINYESINQNCQSLDPKTPKKDENIKPIDINTNNKDTITNSPFIMNQRIAPLKYDPKSLKLGGRPQSICSSLCPSPQSGLSCPSPKSGNIKKLTNNRVLITSSSPMNFQNKNNINIINQNNGIITDNSSSSNSTSPSSLSSSSIIATNCKPQKLMMTPTKSSTPIKSISSSTQPILLSSLSAKNSPMAKKSLDFKGNPLSQSCGPKSQTPGSTLLISSKSQQKITQRIAHELSKFRMSTQIDDENDQIDNRPDPNICDNDERKSLGKNSNEVWLEYGCI